MKRMKTKTLKNTNSDSNWNRKGENERAENSKRDSKKMMMKISMKFKKTRIMIITASKKEAD